MALDKFHLFPNLPPEIQDIIWQLCIPRRVIGPLYAADEQEKLGRLPGTRSRKDLPIHALMPFRPPLISRVCRAARATALRCGQHTPVSVQEILFTTSGGSVWLNKKSDWIYFSYISMMDGLDDDDMAPQVMELARDVSVPLLISSSIQGDHENPLHNSSQDEETVGSWLYKTFFRGREHFYYVMAEVILVVSGKGRERVVETGLFGLLGEDTAIVPTTDKEMLRQYESLFDKYDTREKPYEVCVAGMRRNLASLINDEDQGTREPRTLVGGILERICEERGELDVSADDLMNEDCSLKPDHAVVERLGISMPTCKKVVIFELRRLDTLLQDSTTRLSGDSTDTTDESETTGTTDTESEESIGGS